MAYLVRRLLENTSNEGFLRAALKDYQANRLGRKWPLIIGGKKITDREYVPSIDPAHPAQVVLQPAGLALWGGVAAPRHAR
jgi:hypothetical protein